MLMPFVTFDFIPTEYSTELLFNFDYDNQEAYNDQLMDIAYDNCNFILNSGSMMLYMFYMFFQIFMIAVYALVNRLTKNRYPKLIERQDKATRTVFWNGFFLLFLQGYIEFAISIVMAFE
jgi:hypothetical protein